MDNKKVEADRGAVRYLMRAIRSTIGNKRYLRDLEILLEEKLKDIAPQDEQTLFYLAHDISAIPGSARREAEQKNFW
jgi:uncharacterized protein YjiS (DUF1127 family)